MIIYHIVTSWELWEALREARPEIPERTQVNHAVLELTTTTAHLRVVPQDWEPQEFDWFGADAMLFHKQLFDRLGQQHGWKEATIYLPSLTENKVVQVDAHMLWTRPIDESEE
ncbi:hypothetical protein [Sulfobacillus harzensis]|uniref:Uncharacterized protein n=1 Tax=Sulfobacillus harzensis TaxID=2729629 RepID=A0A7Y0Q4G8_9FIRM|nr:hypothetical protein [Sulfobacillus harzensis]NMP24617.1 hypothetical protein [Sulfobacillus harzensis]